MLMLPDSVSLLRAMVECVPDELYPPNVLPVPDCIHGTAFFLGGIGLHLENREPDGRTEPAATPEVPTGKRRKISAAARKRMKEGQQRRWAKIRRESEPSSPSVTPEPSKPKRKLSAAGKANIVAALRKRLAAKKAAAKAVPAVVKKSAAKKTAKAEVQPTA
jgi:hypothetical protein